MKRERLQEIDRLRGVAALMVVFHHFNTMAWNRALGRWASETWSGVDLFFVISGFLVTSSFLRMKSQQEKAHSAIKLFLRRRLTVILPVAWLWALIPCAVAVLLGPSVYLSSPEQLIQSLIHIVGFNYNYYSSWVRDFSPLSVYWSLAIEEHFYIFLPFFLSLVVTGSARVRWLMLIIGLSPTVIRFFSDLSTGSDWWALRIQTHNRLDSLALGTLIGVVTKNPSVNESVVKRWIPQRVNRFLGPLFTLSLIFWISVIPVLLDRVQIHRFGFTLLAMISGALVFCAQLEKGWVQIWGPLDRVLEAVGQRSYSVYLTHVFAISVALEWVTRKGVLDPSRVIVSVLALFFLFIFAELTYRTVELPLRRLARTSEK